MKTSLGGGCCDGDGGCGGGGLLPVEGRPVCLPGGIPSTAVAATYCRVPPALNHRRYCLSHSYIYIYIGPRSNLRPTSVRTGRCNECNYCRIFGSTLRIIPKKITAEAHSITLFYIVYYGEKKPYYLS